ncbi:aminotransferase class V-fold PLP-dependent enzyme [Frankia sp. AgB1.9]|uniref:aminotransferase class V-fold PLP-dependent enzyme n=1 Tax=unclassified Frankia TaxID=2632575 RepID=UPI0019325273|nr:MULTISPECIES: aminotransferase class V-fold PLP-dependent enzyme [unclassified Frankia]MBL7486657.1 aminotransferase class V-fold PLP-dependent enzyme [Frankia sp. AgW1.1]MBL7553335.1 aminotransferase class V-fold PLP-dependent enzyme [Frankia sp. AgB1.9]MBL7624838.1 aminotransferase class V-fold PLP-dependent enzyme [Frankia sp. AgB1.8]
MADTGNRQPTAGRAEGPADPAGEGPAAPGQRRPTAPTESALPGDELGQAWLAARAGLTVTHLDTAAAGVPSGAVRAAQTAYLATEASLGSYAAQYEVAAGPLAVARGTLAGLLDPALRAADVAFHHSATSALAALLAAWPLPPGGRVGIVPSDFRSNWLALLDRAARDGLELVDLPTQPDGRLDVDRLARGDGPAALDGLDLVMFPEVPSQRGIVQPTAAVAALCRAAGVPLLLDVAQSLGQVDVTAAGATGGVTAYAGTSRKWLCGPRGVGFVAVRPDFAERLGVAAASGYAAGWEPDPAAPGGSRVVPAPGLSRFDVGEAPVAGWLGFAAALAEHADAGPGAVRARIHALAGAARRRLDGLAGWRLGEDVDSPCGIVTLLPAAGVDPAAVKDRLAGEERILTTAIGPARARDAVPVLRVSPPVHATLADLDRLAEALERLSH